MLICPNLKKHRTEIYAKIGMIKLEPKYYQSRCSLLPGSSYAEILDAARKAYKNATNKSRRTPYINSKYKKFKTDKVFLDAFWVHIFQKGRRERSKRLRLYECALDLLRNTQMMPEVIDKYNDKLYRFFGVARTGEKFCVQVKEEVETGRKHFMSVFPWNKA